MPFQRPILRSCCCWRSLKTGSYAAATYTFLYFSLTVVAMTQFLIEERLYLLGITNSTVTTTLLDKRTISNTTVKLNIILFSLGWMGEISTLLLICGLINNYRLFLIPWILTMTLCIAFEMCHGAYMLILQLTHFYPITAVIFTLDFFLISGHVYSLLCVISKYQEYRFEERGLIMYNLNEIQLVSHVNAAPTTTDPQEEDDEPIVRPINIKIDHTNLPHPGPPALVTTGPRTNKSAKRVKFHSVLPNDDGMTQIDDD